MSAHPTASVRPSQRLRSLAGCVHGSVTDRELKVLGLERSTVIEFSASTNPLGPSPAVRLALESVEVGRYPDDEALALRLTLAERTGLDCSSLLPGNGSVELLWLLALAYLDPGDRVLVVGPTFGEYARAARICGAAVTEWRARASASFQPEVPAIVAQIAQLQPRMVFLCNPNNPTGALLARPAIEQLLAATPGILVVDEAYISFVDQPPQLLDLVTSGRLVVLRSLTKDYALTGLRLGYLAAASEVIRNLDKVRPPWSVNSAAQSAGVAALGDDEHLQNSRAEVRASRTYLLAELALLGLPVAPAAANFLLVATGDARTFRTQLLEFGCCVRDCTSFGLPDYVRIGVRTLPECRQLVQAMKALLGTDTAGVAL